MDTNTTARIMAIAKDNTMAAIVLTGITQNRIEVALDNLEKLKITREMIICFWAHACAKNRDAFDEFVINLKERPTGCAAGCVWEPATKDESEIFGPTMKESWRDCAMAECETPSRAYCSYCYCVRYCSPLCQRMDRDRHRAECKRLVDALNLVKVRGHDYAKRAIKNNISISDESWVRLWAKYGANQAKNDD